MSSPKSRDERLKRDQQGYRHLLDLVERGNPLDAVLLGQFKHPAVALRAIREGSDEVADAVLSYCSDKTRRQDWACVLEKMMQQTTSLGRAHRTTKVLQACLFALKPNLRCQYAGQVLIQVASRDHFSSAQDILKHIDFPQDPSWLTFQIKAMEEAAAQGNSATLAVLLDHFKNTDLMTVKMLSSLLLTSASAGHRAATSCVLDCSDQLDVLSATVGASKNGHAKLVQMLCKPEHILDVMLRLGARSAPTSPFGPPKPPSKPIFLWQHALRFAEQLPKTSPYAGAAVDALNKIQADQPLPPSLLQLWRTLTTHLGGISLKGELRQHGKTSPSGASRPTKRM